MREIMDRLNAVLTETHGRSGKWWYNAISGEVIELPEDLPHRDAVSDRPQQFGVDADTVRRLKLTYPDGDDLTWWEALGYEAQKRGWVRVGSDHGDTSTPYLYAASIPLAQATLRWMLKNAIVIDQVDVEITNPEHPLEGYGAYGEMRNEQDLTRFLRSGKFPVLKGLTETFEPGMVPITSQQLTATIKQLRDEWVSEGKVPDYRAIGDGHCYDFCREVFNRLGVPYAYGEHQPQTGIWTVRTEDYWRDDFVFSIPALRKAKEPVPTDIPTRRFAEEIGAATHEWIKHQNGLHYDATCPEGSRHFLDMPFFRDQIEGVRRDMLSETIEPGTTIRRPRWFKFWFDSRTGQMLEFSLYDHHAFHAMADPTLSAIIRNSMDGFDKFKKNFQKAYEVFMDEGQDYDVYGAFDEQIFLALSEHGYIRGTFENYTVNMDWDFEGADPKFTAARKCVGFFGDSAKRVVMDWDGMGHAEFREPDVERFVKSGKLPVREAVESGTIR